MPPAADAQCRSISEWVGTKLRWQLSVDEAEFERLKVYAEGPREDAIVNYTLAP